MSRPNKLVNGVLTPLTDVEYADFQAALNAEPTLEERQAAAKKECQRRIFAVADSLAQVNLAADAAAGLLPAEQLATYKAGLVWIKAMRAAWRGLADDASDISDDKNWPAPTQAMIDLANAF